MKKGTKNSFFIKHKKDLVYLGILIIVIIIGIVIFMQLKQSPNDNNFNVQNQKYSEDIPENTNESNENEGELGTHRSGGGPGGGSNIIVGSPAEESPGTGGPGSGGTSDGPANETNESSETNNSSPGLEGASHVIPPIKDNSTSKTPINKIEICNDGIDNDGDNLKDCKDADCDDVKVGYNKTFGG